MHLHTINEKLFFFHEYSFLQEKKNGGLGYQILDNLRYCDYIFPKKLGKLRS